MHGPSSGASGSLCVQSSPARPHLALAWTCHLPHPKERPRAADGKPDALMSRLSLLQPTSLTPYDEGHAPMQGDHPLDPLRCSRQLGGLVEGIRRNLRAKPTNFWAQIMRLPISLQGSGLPSPQLHQLDACASFLPKIFAGVELPS